MVVAVGSTRQELRCVLHMHYLRVMSSDIAILLLSCSLADSRRLPAAARLRFPWVVGVTFFCAWAKRGSRDTIGRDCIVALRCVYPRRSSKDVHTYTSSSANLVRSSCRLYPLSHQLQTASSHNPVLSDLRNRRLTSSLTTSYSPVHFPTKLRP